MIITQQEYDELYQKVKRDVMNEINKSPKLPYKEEHSRLVQHIEDEILEYRPAGPAAYRTKSGVYEVLKVALNVETVSDFKTIGTTQAENFIDDLFQLIEQYNLNEQKQTS